MSGRVNDDNEDAEYEDDDMMEDYADKRVAVTIRTSEVTNIE